MFRKISWIILQIENFLNSLSSCDNFDWHSWNSQLSILSQNHNSVVESSQRRIVRLPIFLLSSRFHLDAFLSPWSFAAQILFQRISELRIRSSSFRRIAFHSACNFSFSTWVAFSQAVGQLILWKWQPGSHRIGWSLFIPRVIEYSLLWTFSLPLFNIGKELKFQRRWLRFVASIRRSLRLRIRLTFFSFLFVLFSDFGSNCSLFVIRKFNGESFILILGLGLNDTYFNFVFVCTKNGGGKIKFFLRNGRGGEAKWRPDKFHAVFLVTRGMFRMRTNGWYKLYECSSEYNREKIMNAFVIPWIPLFSLNPRKWVLSCFVC